MDLGYCIKCKSAVQSYLLDSPVDALHEVVEKDDVAQADAHESEFKRYSFVTSLFL